jgi:hypothetical protein
VVDAAAGDAWSREEAGPQWGTQLSRLDEAEALLGLGGGAAGVREEVAREVGLSPLVLRDTAEGLRRHRGYQHRGEQLLSLLEDVGSGPCVLERVLALGALAGLWGAVHFWLPGVAGAGPSRLLFPGTGMPSG